MGYKLDLNIPAGTKRCVLVSAPHTSNWDFVIGRLAMWAYQLDVKLIIKKELFFFPMGFFLKALGGIPVDRKNKKSNITGQVAQMFEENEDLCVLFTPEGTRSYNPNWKKGFYYLAEKANVPIYLGYLDYEKKIGGIFPEEFIPTGDANKDILEIKKRYKNVKGKFPENGVR
ncbi:MAG: 1-acyl-sn-glycerol-3-phosphate acyltransferase [Crocinitomicaceae bacterium]